MTVCNIKWLKSVDGNPVGRVVTGVERDELVEMSFFIYLNFSFSGEYRYSS